MKGIKEHFNFSFNIIPWKNIYNFWVSQGKLIIIPYIKMCVFLWLIIVFYLLQIFHNTKVIENNVSRCLMMNTFANIYLLFYFFQSSVQLLIGKFACWWLLSVICILWILITCPLYSWQEFISTLIIDCFL